MTKKLNETEAIKIYLLPGERYNVDPPASLASKVRTLPLYKERYYKSGFILRSKGELLLWIEGVVKRKF